MIKKLVLVAAVAMAAGMIQAAWATVVLNVTVDNPTGLDWDTEVDPDGHTVEVELHTYYDPQYPPALKIFETDGTAGVIHLTEYIHIETCPPWTDWHEELLVWVEDEWQTDFAVLSESTGSWEKSTPDDGLYWQPPYSVDPDGWIGDDGSEHPDIVWVLWDEPIPANTWVTIEKEIHVPEGVYTFAIAEWPTIPEPSTFGLLGVGLIPLLRLRRRR